MKSFYDLRLIERNPAHALHIEDGPHPIVNWDGYDGLRGLSEVLARSAKASEISELRDLAVQLELDEVRVVRVTEEAGGTVFLSPDAFTCLQEFGIYLFAICTGDSTSPESAKTTRLEFLRLANLVGQ